MRNMALQTSRTKLKDTKLCSNIYKVINLFQIYYGMTITQNTNNIHNIWKAIVAVLYHCSGRTLEETQHLL